MCITVMQKFAYDIGNRLIVTCEYLLMLYKLAEIILRFRLNTKVNLLHCHHLPIFILLHIMLVFLMLFTALFNAVCLYDAYSSPIDINKYFLFSCYIKGY